MDPLTIIAFFTAVFDMIAKCREDREDEDIATGMVTPGRLERYACDRTARKTLRRRGKLRGLTRTERRAAIGQLSDIGMARLATTSHEEILATVQGRRA